MDFVGLIPVAGATTGLIAIYSFVTFQDPIYVSCIHNCDCCNIQVLVIVFMVLL